MTESGKTQKRRNDAYGVGINDADYAVTRSASVDGKTKTVWCCPFYTRWRSMLTRCYSLNHQNYRPSYIGCKVCDDWKSFSKFKSWMETQDWEGRELDKDILSGESKVYSPETCFFVTRRINLFLTERNVSRGEWPIGVNFHKPTSRFKAQCNNPFTLKREFLGYFSIPEEAHLTYCKKKLEFAYKIIEEEKPEQRVADAIIKRYTGQLNEAEKLLNNIQGE